MRKRSSFLFGRYRSEIIGLICRIGKRNQELIQVNFRCRAKGWLKVVEKFTTQLVPEMRQFTDSFVVLLMDFDQREDRLTLVTSQIPEDLKDRVFVLGVLSEPENLKRNINKTFEEIGDSLAKDCPDNKNELWRHDLLRHNETELDRIVSSVQLFLFRA